MTILLEWKLRRHFYLEYCPYPIRNPTVYVFPPTGNEAGLVGYWNFNEGSGNTVTDLSGNGNNGTISGATWSTDAPAQYVNNCTATDDIIVTVNPLPTIDLGADTTLICAGTIETLDAGTGFVSYLWSDGSTNQTLSATTAGTYTVVGTDANGCTASDSMVLDILTVDIIQNDTAICEGDSLVLELGPLSGNINSGLIAYYPFNGNANDESGNGNNGTVNGATLTTDRFGNSNSAYDFDGNDYIQSPNWNSLLGNTNFTTSFWVKHTPHAGWILCFGNSADGEGFTAGSYHWGSNNVGGQIWKYDYISSVQSTVSQNVWSNIVFKYSNNSVSIYHNGNFVTSESVNYTATNLQSGSLNIGKQLAFNEYYTGQIDDVGIWNRALSDQEIQQLYSGTSNYTYNWSPNGETTSSITVQPSVTTTYTVDVTSGTTTCQSDVTISVNQRDFVTLDSTACDSIQWNGNWLASTGTYFDTLQNIAGCDSVVTLDLTVLTKSFSLTNESACDSMLFANEWITSSGIYRDTLTAVNGCDSIVTINLTINNSPIVDLGNDTTLCEGASINLNAGSGFNYLWSDASTSQTLTTSITGEYSVTITDVNGCQDSDTINVLISPIVINLTNIDSVLCNGGSDGLVTIEVSGGTPGYNVSWTGTTIGDPAGEEIANSGDSYTINTFPTGNYTITVTDQNNCTASTPSFDIEEPTLLSATTDVSEDLTGFVYSGEYNGKFLYYHSNPLSWPDARAKCQSVGGDLIVIKSETDQVAYNAAFGSGNGWIGLYQNTSSPNFSEPRGGWEWVDGTTLDFNTNTNTWVGYSKWNGHTDGSTDGEPNDAGDGEDYAQFVGAVGNFSWNDYFNISTLPFYMEIPINSFINGNHVTCFNGNDGNIGVTAVGGTTPYTYLWNDANAQTTDTAFNVVAGEYIVIVTDSNGCTASDTATITQPDLITGKDSITACDTYTWMDGNAYTASNNIATHTLTAANGCDSVVSLDLTIINSPTVDLGNDIAICQGDSTLLDAGSGYTNYLWNTGETTQTIHVNTAGTYSVSIGNGTPVINNNSLSFDGVDDFVDAGQADNVDILSNNASWMAWVKCNDLSTNQAIASKWVSGPNTQWAVGRLSSSPTEFYLALRSTGGSYNEILSNGFNFQANEWTHVSVIWDGDNVLFYKNGVLISTSFVGQFSLNATTGNLIIGAQENGTGYNWNGLISNYSNWDTALSQSEIQQYMSSPPTGNESGLVGFWNFNEGSGNTVTDLSGNGNIGTINGATWSTDAPAQYANNCTATDDVVVMVNSLPNIDLGADTTLICAGTNETIDAGTGFTSYLWGDGSTAQTLSANSAGTYTVTGTDANGCSASDSMVIDILTVAISQNDTTICEGNQVELSLEYFGNSGYNIEIQLEEATLVIFSNQEITAMMLT